MIPNLTILIAAYIVFRCCEIMTANESRFSSQGAKGSMCVFAILLILGSIYLTAETVSAAARVSGLTPFLP